MKKNIALFVSYLDNEFSMDIIDGAWLAAEDLDVNLFIFPTRLLLENYAVYSETRYEYQYNTTLSYVDKGNFDGVIVETGVICNGMTEAGVKSLFEKFGEVPVVSIARKIEGYPNVCFNGRGLRDEIEHLIHEHGCRKIGFMGGPYQNLEAKERLKIYQETLEENGIEFDENLCGMGNFSEFCVDEVKNLFLRNGGKLDALCFANDRMAIGGYQAMRELGLVPGKDVMVTGFDDAPSASVMKPALTTVRSNVSTLGYRAVQQCLRLVKGAVPVDENIDTSMIVRSSCGCPSKANVISEKLRMTGTVEKIDEKELCQDLQTFLSGTLNDESSLGREIKAITDGFYRILCLCKQPDFDPEKTMEEILPVIEHMDFDSLPYNEFSFALSQVRRKAAVSAYDREKISEFFFDLAEHIAATRFADAYHLRQTYREFSMMSSWIVHDVLRNILNEDESFFSIIRNIHRHGSKSCYLYIHEFPISCRSFSAWHRPRTERLVCYQNGEKEVLLPHEEQTIPSDIMFRVPQLPEGRHTFICNPLFCDDEHFGLLVCEMDKSNYTYLGWVIVKQISYAMKTKLLMETQLEEQERLSKSMELMTMRNEQLRQTSISDELTGKLNRRGFMEIVSAELSNPSNFGRHTVIAFADMNYLKMVNDTYGHDEGDFAIRGASEILTRCFRLGDVIARFGGDEFAAFCFTEPDCNFESLYRERVERVTATFNQNHSDKPYLVTLSTGIYEFTCEQDTNLTECLNAADALLYEDKKKKPKSIIREKTEDQ